MITALSFDSIFFLKLIINVSSTRMFRMTICTLKAFTFSSNSPTGRHPDLVNRNRIAFVTDLMLVLIGTQEAVEVGTIWMPMVPWLYFEL